MSTFSQEYNNVCKFTTLSDSEKERIVNLMCSKNEPRDYWYELILEKLLPHLSDKQILDITLNIIYNGEKRGRGVAIYKCIKKSYTLDPVAIKKALNSIDEQSILKILTILDPNQEEEIKGLRALSTSKSTPQMIYESNYVPSYAAIKSLPPVTRLNVLETLTNSNYLNYNIFANFDQEGFEHLLFPNIIRHSKRVSMLLEKFTDIQYRGKDSIISINAECERCGPFEFTLKSQTYRTETGLRATNVGRMMMGIYCPFCYKGLKKQPIFEDKN